LRSGGGIAKPIPRDFERKEREGTATNYLDILKGWNFEKYLAGIINQKLETLVMKKINP
jgi:hypothetical protein